MGAEDPAVAVGLIHDHIAEAPEEPGPPRMVREDAEVQHVRVGEDEIRMVPDPAPGSGIGVAVIGFGPDGGELQGPDRGQLVGGQCLGGGQIEGHGAVVVDFPGIGQDPELGTVDRVQGRQLIRQGLSGRRAGGNDHVLSGMGQLGGLDLVEVGLVDAQGTVGALRDPGGTTPATAH